MKRIIVALGLVVASSTPAVMAASGQIAEAPRPWVLTGAWASTSLPGEVQLPVQWLYPTKDACESAALPYARNGLQTWCIQPEWAR